MNNLNNTEPLIKTNYGNIKLSDIPVIKKDSETRKICMIVITFVFIIFMLIVLIWYYYVNDKQNKIDKYRNYNYYSY